MASIKPLDQFVEEEVESDIEIIKDEEGDDFDNFDDVVENERMQDDDREPELTADQIQHLQNELLFAVQGVGEIKRVNDMDFYVKSKYCEASLRDIIKFIRNDSSSHPHIKMTLGEWQFLQKDLLSLLYFHKQDKKLAYLTLIILVHLTEYPQHSEAQLTGQAAFLSEKQWTNPKSPYKHQMLETLRSYKEAFLYSRVVPVIMEHLADCIQKKDEDRTEKHEQLIELIVVLFKQLLQIPDPKPVQTDTKFQGKDLHKNLILTYQSESVLDSFNYLSQEFSTPIQKKLALHIVEIHFAIFKFFTPQQIFVTKEAEESARQEMYATQNAHERRRKFLKSLRHTKFGTQLAVTRPDGSQAMVTNIYQKSIDVSNLEKKQRMKSTAVHGKNAAKNKIETTGRLVNEASLQDSDRKLIEVVRNYLRDIIDNTFNALVKEVHEQITTGKSGLITGVDEVFDRYHFFKLCSFVVQVQRLSAYEQHTASKKEAIEKAKAEQNGGKANDINSLFDQSKKRARGLGEKVKAAPKLNVPKVPFQIKVRPIGECLQLNNFEFLYGQLYKKIKMGKSKPGENFISDKEFHAALQLLVQFLYLIRDMASSDDEKNQRNSKILSQNVFYNDLCIVSHFALNLYDPRKHSVQFLHDTVEFTHLMLEMLDEYSKGKVLTIQTQRKRKVKKAKKKAKKARASNPENGELEEFGQQEDDIYFDSDDNEFGEEDSEEEENVERKFNFVSEISVLVDYNVINKYVSVIKDYDNLKRNPSLVKACAHFFKRIVNQTKQTWIFFQASTLSVLNEFNQRGVTTNSLMRGLNEIKPTTTMEKQLHSYSLEMKQVINQIAGKFVELIQKNQLAAVEVLFKFPSRQLKDSILNNYEDRPATDHTATSVSRVEKEEIKEMQEIQDIIDINNFAEAEADPQEEKPDVQLGFQDEAPVEEKKGELVWTQEMDELLITNYENFKSLGSECYALIADLIPGTTDRQCKERGHVLKLKKNSADAARDLSRKLISKQSTSMMGKKVGVAFRQFVSGKLAQQEASELPRTMVKEYLEYVKRIHQEYSAFRQEEDNLVLLGGELELADLKREAQHGKTGNMREASQMKCPFVVVPVNVDDFNRLSDPCFLQLLACFGVKVGTKQNVFPRIEGSVSKEQMASAVEAMEALMMDTFKRADGVDKLEDVDMEGCLTLENLA